ncbi:g10869 [Coccomyxa elongata]
MMATQRCRGANATFEFAIVGPFGLRVLPRVGPFLPRQRRSTTRCSVSPPSGQSGCLTASKKRSRSSVIALISEAVSINAAVQRFETLAGRSAMVGFVIALLAECAVPVEGLFGSWDGRSLSVFGASSLLLISVAAVLASMSTRRVGQKLQSSVLTSLTALSTAKDGLDKNVDLIFEDVFGRDFLRDIVNLDMDDFL